MDVEALSRAAGAAGSIARAADATGVDFAYLMNAAMRESAFNPNARNPKSSASGMFQFIEQTWLAMVKRHGGKHGLASFAQDVKINSDGRFYVANAAQKREILGLRFDPETAAKLAGELTAENTKYLASKLGRPPNNAELYAAHVLGPRAAAQLSQIAEERPNTRAASLFPVAARGNRPLFYSGDGRTLTAREALEGFGAISAGIDKVTPSQTALKEPLVLRGRFQVEDDHSSRAAFMGALMELQSKPIGFAEGGFGVRGDDEESNASLLMRAFKHQL